MSKKPPRKSTPGREGHFPRTHRRTWGYEAPGPSLQGLAGSGGKRARRHHLGVVWADGSCREPRAQSGDRGSFRAVRGAVAPRRLEHTERRAREAVRSAGEGENVCSRTQASTRMVLTISSCTVV